MDRSWSDGWWMYLLKGIFIILIGITALLLLRGVKQIVLKKEKYKKCKFARL